MIKQFFTQPTVLSRLEEGVFGPHLTAFGAALHEEGYSRGCIRRHLRAADHFGVWLTDRRLTDWVNAVAVTPDGRATIAGFGGSQATQDKAQRCLGFSAIERAQGGVAMAQYHRRPSFHSTTNNTTRMALA